MVEPALGSVATVTTDQEIHVNSRPRFAWLNAVTGHRLPEDALDDPVAAWEAAARALDLEMPELARHVAEKFRLEVADLERQIPEDQGILPVDLAVDRLAVPLAQKARSVEVASCDPGSEDLVQQIEFATGRDVILRVAPPTAVLEALAVLSEGMIEPQAEWEGPVFDDASGWDASGAAVMGEEDPEAADEMNLSSENPAILDLLITHAVRMGASDIHVQAAAHGAVVRYRVDGVLQAGPKLSLSGLASVLGRAKAVGGMDPSVRIRAQDGRGGIRVDGSGFDLRFSTLPSSGSESLVIRVLAQGGTLDFDSYGADADSTERLREGFLNQTSGVFVVTGPTGSERPRCCTPSSASSTTAIGTSTLWKIR